MMADRMPQHGCMTDEDFYCYLTHQGDGERFSHLESHLVKCPACRSGLANLIELLHPENDQESCEFSEPTKLEIEETVNLIRGEPLKDSECGKRAAPWLRWPLAAAAAIAFIALSFLGARYFYDIHKADAFFAQAKAIVDQRYTGASPSQPPPCASLHRNVH